MDSFTLNISTREPIGFREYCSDIVFYAEVSGVARVSFYNAECFGRGEEGKEALRDTIITMIPQVFENWPEGKLIMGPGNREILEEGLREMIKSLGTSAEIGIRDERTAQVTKMSHENDDLSHEQISAGRLSVL